MSGFIEAFIQDLVWEWIEQQDRYIEVAPEISIGNYGRIDLVAKTKTNEYHGFEIKNIDGAIEQVSRYSESGYFDEVYHCSRNRIPWGFSDFSLFRSNKQRDWFEGGSGERIATSVEAIANKLARGVSEGRYSEEEVFETVLYDLFTDELLFMNLLQTFGERTTIHSIFRSCIKDSEAKDIHKESISLQEGKTRLQAAISFPDIGFINLPMDLPYHDDGADNGRFGRHNKFNSPIEKVISFNKVNDISIIKEAPKLDRSFSPPINDNHEAWVQHFLWKHWGSIREAQIPTKNTVRIIDVLKFEGGYTATDILKNQKERELIGIEAKTRSSFSPKSSVADQLRSYLNSGSLTRLFLGVPTDMKEVGLDLLKEENLTKVGLMIVDSDGVVSIERNAQKLTMKYDGFVSQGTRGSEYLREIGYGTVITPDRDEFQCLRRAFEE